MQTERVAPSSLEKGWPVWPINQQPLDVVIS
jgi:hypothetical protein